MKNKLNILVAPLDWGLGHASRCIPLIQNLLIEGHRVTVAASGPSQVLIREAFPGLPFIELEGYHIHYAYSSKAWISIALQLIKIRKAIKKENTWLKQVQQLHKFDRIISDNRYGLHHPDTENILVTHQLSPAMPASLKWCSGIAKKIISSYCKAFDEIWIPDNSEGIRLSGKLSDSKIPNVRFIGPLSRFSFTIPELDYHYQVCFLLSGPEPLRSYFENKIFSQLDEMPKPAVIIRGLPMDSKTPGFNDREIEIYNHLDKPNLQKILSSSRFVIARAGYSTIMDLFVLKKNALLVPTPGQTEQEYLATCLKENNLFAFESQKKFSIAKAIQLLRKREEIQEEVFGKV